MPAIKTNKNTIENDFHDFPEFPFKGLAGLLTVFSVMFGILVVLFFCLFLVEKASVFVAVYCQKRRGSNNKTEENAHDGITVNEEQDIENEKTKDEDHNKKGREENMDGKNNAINYRMAPRDTPLKYGTC